MFNWFWYMMLKFSRFCPVSLGRPGAEGPTRKRSECFVRVHKEFQRVVFERADFEIVCGGPAESKGAMRRAAGFALTPSQERTVRNRKERNGREPGNGLVLWGEERSGLDQGGLLFAVDVAGEVARCREMRLSAETCSEGAFTRAVERFF